jgi:N-acetylglucosamine kinase-like BadF-type ATPase
MGVILAVDGGNSKTELVVATTEGECLALVRGEGSNSHAVGVDGAVAVIGALIAESGASLPAEHAVFFLCGADVPADIVELHAAVAAAGWARETRVDNDTFALLRAGTDAADAVAVICGSGINCVGRAAGGRTARYPSLGWETGDWGGSEMLGRDVLFLAARAHDGRGEQTALLDVVREHFGMSVEELGEAVHYKRLTPGRLGELAPAGVEAATQGDAVARSLIERLGEEIVLMATRALTDLELVVADVVLGGGMLRSGRGFLFDEVATRLQQRAPGARPVAAADAPVLGSALVALEAAGAPTASVERLRLAFRDGLVAEDLRAG